MLILAYKRKQVDTHLLIVGTSFLVAHLVQNITVFENPTSYLYFVFWLAFINRMAAKTYSPFPNQMYLESSSSKHGLDRKVSIGLSLITGVVVFGFIFVFNMQPARANRNTLIALSLINGGLVDQSVAQINTVLAFDSPHIDDIRGDVARGVLGLVSQKYKTLGNEKVLSLLNSVYPALQKNLELHPMDIRSQIVLADFSRFRAIIENNPDSLREGEKYLEDALSFSPRRQQVIYMLVDFKQALKKIEEAKKLLEQSIQDNPKIAEGYLRLAFIYKSALNDPKKADEIIREGKKYDIDFGGQELGYVISSTTTSSKK
jgi:tetratricopeptide (TPR) repeat protein